MRGHAAVPGRLFAPPVPRFFVRAETFLHFGRERLRAIFVGIDRRLFLVARFEGAAAGVGHEAELLQLGDALDVDRAPDAAAAARREADRVALVVDAPADAGR